MSRFDPTSIERPDPKLFRYYLLASLLTGPLTPVVLLPLWFRYATLKYKFDEDGVSMCWGILFRREVYLTYRRIQDIHLTRNILERWMGLAKISLQTASGSSQAEMTIEGILEAEELRDYLYSRMRGAKEDSALHFDLNCTPSGAVSGGNSVESIDSPSGSTRVQQLLEEIRNALVILADSKQTDRPNLSSNRDVSN